MEITKGKMKNLKEGKEITFAINPSQYELSKSFDFTFEPLLAKSSPLIAFRCGGVSVLKFQLCFDTDMGLEENALKNVQGFLKGLNAIDPDTASVPPVEFKMGSTVFKGFVRTYRWLVTRFDPKGEPLSAVLDVEMVSDGEGDQK